MISEITAEWGCVRAIRVHSWPNSESWLAVGRSRDNLRGCDWSVAWSRHLGLARPGLFDVCAASDLGWCHHTYRLRTTTVLTWHAYRRHIPPRGHVFDVRCCVICHVHIAAVVSSLEWSSVECWYLTQQVLSPLIISKLFSINQFVCGYEAMKLSTCCQNGGQDFSELKDCP